MYFLSPCMYLKKLFPILENFFAQFKSEYSPNYPFYFPYFSTLSSTMDFNNIHHVFKSIVDNFNLEDGQNRGLHLDYHIFSGVIDSVVYELEITILAMQEKVSLPCYILPEDNPKPKILRTLGILNEFVKITHKEQ